MRIDSHQHFWRYNATEFYWIGDDMATLRRDFLPVDLEAEMRACGIDGAILVEARQTLQETDWLLQLASTREFLRGVVGWLPLVSPDIEAVLERYEGAAKLVGARHVVQAEDDGFLARDDFNRGMRALTKSGLIYDLLVIEHQLPETIAFVDRHPNQVFVLDHIAKPRIRENVMQPWANNLRELGNRDNVFCKISGFVTEADFAAWTPRALQPYFDIALEAFTPSRLMFGSDWPVCRAACEYSHWLQTVEEFAAPLSPDEKHQLFGPTAMRAYRLPE